MSVGATYREGPAPAALADVAEARWSVRFERAADDWLVLPDGVLDLVLVAGAPPRVAGPATMPLRLAYPAGASAVGLRLAPGAAPALLGADAAELRDLHVELADLSIGGLERAQDALERGEPGRAGDLLVAAVARLARRAEPDPLVRAAAQALRRDPGLATTGVAVSVFSSPRQLRRRFERGVGYGPKRFARVMRMQAFLRLQRGRPQASLAELAAAAGYADQAHLARDCRALAGRPPSALVSQRAGIEQAG